METLTLQNELIDCARPINHAIGIQYPVNLMIKWDYLALLSNGEVLSCN